MNLNTKLKKIFAVILALYFAFAGVFYAIAKDQLSFRDSETTCMVPAENIGEILQGQVIRQRIMPTAEEITGVSLTVSTFERTNTSHLTFTIRSEEGAALAERTIDCAGLTDNAAAHVTFTEPVKATANTPVYLEIISADAVPGNAVTVWVGTAYQAARTEVWQEIAPEDLLTIDGVPQSGGLSISVLERENLWTGQHYVQLVLGFGAAIAALFGYLLRCISRGKSTALLRCVSAFSRYNFLLRQLVARDFKTKYKRSVLGVLWSFLNPLLTMMVQYIVFSALFKSDIPNFALYLISGIVCFNFFSEATSMSLMSIVGNANLITKVYVPKYIYPVSRVLSSTINLLFSLIPLAGVMLLTHTPIRPVIILLPFGVGCLVAFCIGMGFILSSAMVFFRDTQFLWGVLSMLWMYATPIFYPESIIPAKFLLLYKCNPLYHIVRFIRIILISGVSPEPKAYVLCLLVSLLPLAIGALIFKKTQDRFILNL